MPEFITEKNVQAKVYAVVFKQENGSAVLHVSLGFSLEDAYVDFIKNSTFGQKKEGWTISIWKIIELDELLSKHLDVDNTLSPPPPPDFVIGDKKVIEKIFKLQEEMDTQNDKNRNAILKKILENKDVELFRTHESELTENEISMIKDKLGLS